MDDEHTESLEYNAKRIEQLTENIEIYEQQGNYKDLLKSELELYQIMDKLLDDNDLDLVVLINNLSLDYSNAGDYANATKYGKEAYERFNQILGPDHPNTLASLNNLSTYYSDNGDYENALKYSKEAYESRLRVLGSDHPDTLMSLNNLAGDYSSMGDYDSALKYGKEAYERCIRALGPNHPNTLMALSNLTNRYTDIGDYKNALKYGKEAYERCNHVLGPNHSNTLTTLYNLASDYSNIGDYENALKYSKKGYEARLKVLGLNHPDTLKSLSNLANRYSDIGDYENALKYGKEVFESRSRVLGPEHSVTLGSLNNLANYYANIRDYENAFKCAKEVYERRVRVMGANHPVTLGSLSNLANYCADIGDYENALKFGIEAYESRSRVLGVNHPETLGSLNNLPKYCLKVGDYANAIKYGKEAYERNNEILGPNSPNTLTSLNNLAIEYSNIEDYENEFIYKNKYFDTSYNMVNQIYSKHTPFANNIIKNYLSYFLRALNRYKNIIFQNIPERKSSYVNLLNYKNTVFDVEFSKNHPIEFTKVEINDIQSKLNSDECIIDYYGLTKGYGTVLITKEKYELYFVEDDIGISIPEGIRHIYICPDGKMYGYSYNDEETKKLITVSHHNFDKEFGNYDYSFLSGPKSLLTEYDDNNSKEIVDVICPQYSIEKEYFDEKQDLEQLYGGYLEDYYIRQYNSNVTTLSGIKAIREEVLKVNCPSILHISTHGGIIEMPDTQIQSIGVLVMSGYNDNHTKGSLSSLDIQGIDLRGTNLVVLSACDTAMGKTKSGEGVYGLRRALELSGVKTQLITTEPISDLNTIIFMKVFYYNYSNSNNAYQSLKETKKYLLDYHNWVEEMRNLKEQLDSGLFDNHIPSFIKDSWNFILNKQIIYSNLRKRTMKIMIEEDTGMIYSISEDFHAFVIQGKIR